MPKALDPDSLLADSDVEQVAGMHTARLMGLEEAEARRMLARMKEIRQELRDRLDYLPEERFTAQFVRGTLMQVEGALESLKSSLAGEMRASADVVATTGVQHLITEIRRFERKFRGAVTPININAALVANDTSNFLFNRYKASSDRYAEDLKGQMAHELTNAVIEQKTTGQVVHRLSRHWHGEEWKLRRLARTELHHVYNLGKLESMRAVEKDQIRGLKKALYHPLDHRTEKDSLKIRAKDPVLPLDEPFRYTWDGRERVFMTPPDRPNDRSVLIPYHDDWVES